MTDDPPQEPFRLSGEHRNEWTISMYEIRAAELCLTLRRGGDDRSLPQANVGGNVREFGRQTLTFVTVYEDTDTRDRYNQPTKVRTETYVPGCRFRPLPATETAKDGAVVVKDQWRATRPPVAAVVGAQSRDEVRVDGVTYQVVGGPRTFADIAGQQFKTTIICERQDG